MLKNIKLSLSLLDKKSQRLVKTFSIVRILIVGLDTIGVILVGLLLAKSADQINDSSETSPTNFFGITSLLDNFSLVQIALIALLFFTSKSILSVFFTKIMSVILARAEADVASSTFNKLLQSEYKNFSHMQRQDIIFSLTTSASFAITEMLSTCVTLLSESTLLIAMAMLFMFVDLKVALGIVIYFSVIGYLIQRVIGPKMHKAGELYAKSSIKSNTAISDAVASFREVTTLNKYEEFGKKFQKGRTGIAKPVAAVTFYSGLPRYIVETALMFGAVFLAAYLFATENASTAAGILGIFLTGSLRIMASMLPLQSSLSNLKRFQASSVPFFDLVNIVHDTKINSSHEFNSSTSKASPVEIVFENVSFNYPESDLEVLRQINLEIKAGEYVAIIGPSGSGKSTLADLMINLLNPLTGKITLKCFDGSPASIGYVPQKPGIISGTILENITLNIDSGDFDQARLTEALKKSHLFELVDSLEMGAHTDLGAQLDGLSGGQLQRIGLARALYSNPGLLILDEATSALDAETESAVADSLNSLRGSCTIVVIAHRLSTVKNADRVFVMDKGQIVASGKFNDLAKSNELLAKYIEFSQLKSN